MRSREEGVVGLICAERGLCRAVAFRYSWKKSVSSVEIVCRDFGEAERRLVEAWV